MVWEFWFCSCGLDVITSPAMYKICASYVLVPRSINCEAFRDSKLCDACFQMEHQNLFFHPWDIYQQRSPHWRRLECIYFHLSTILVHTLCQIPKYHPTDSSITSCLISICVKIASLTIILVIVFFCSVSILPLQYQSAIVSWDLLVIRISGTLWIRLSLHVAHIAIKSLLWILFLVLIGPLRWKSTSAIGCRYHTGNNSMDHCHISLQNQNTLLEY